MVISATTVGAADSVFRRCDSTVTAMYANVIFGPEMKAWTSVTVQPRWEFPPNVGPQVLSRVNTQFLDAIVDVPFHMTRLSWSDSIDSVDVVLFRTIDSSGFYEPRQAIAPTWYSGTHLVFIGELADGPQLLESICLDSTVLRGFGTSTGPDVTELQWLDSVGHITRLLDLVTEQIGVLDASSYSREGFWCWESSRLSFLTSMERSNYQPKPEVYNFGTSREFQDVNGDGLRELVLTRRWGWGAGTGIRYSDSGAILWTFRETPHETICSAELLPTAAFVGDTVVLLNQRGGPYSVFPRWHIPGFIPKSRGDTLTIARMNGYAPRGLSTFARSNDGDINREGTAVLSAWTTADSLYFRVDVVDSIVLASKWANPKPPRYDVAIWITPNGIIHHMTAHDSCQLVIISADTVVDSTTIRTFSIDENAADCTYFLQSTRSTGLERLNGYQAYSFQFGLPREQIGFLSATPVPAMLGIALEVLKNGTNPCDGQWNGVSQSEPKFSRDDPATWGTLMEGVRVDFFSPRQR